MLILRCVEDEFLLNQASQEPLGKAPSVLLVFLVPIFKRTPDLGRCIQLFRENRPRCCMASATCSAGSAVEGNIERSRPGLRGSFQRRASS